MKLADGKARTIQHMMMTSFWHPDGTPMSARQFMEMLFGQLPAFFHDEDELRAIWSAPATRAERVANAQKAITAEFTTKQQTFLDFVLSHYIAEGVQELDQEKLTPLLKLKYHDAISDAILDLGAPAESGNLFVGFKKYLYQAHA